MIHGDLPIADYASAKACALRLAADSGVLPAPSVRGLERLATELVVATHAVLARVGPLQPPPLPATFAGDAAAFGRYRAAYPAALDGVLARLPDFPPAAEWWVAHLSLVHFLVDCIEGRFATAQIPSSLGDLASALVSLDAARVGERPAGAVQEAGWKLVGEAISRDGALSAWSESQLKAMVRALVE